MADPPRQDLADFRIDLAPQAQPHRNNLIEQNQAIREHAEDRVGLFVSKFIYWFRVAMFFCLVTEIIIVLILRWDEGSKCPQPLRGFLLTFAINSTLLLLTNIYYYKILVCGAEIDNGETLVERIISSLHRTTEISDQLVMIFGFLTVTVKNVCKKEAPVLWGVSVQIVAMRLTIWILPMLLLTCLFCCFGGVLLIVSKYSRWKDRQRVVEMLDSIPKHKYKEDEANYGNTRIERDSADCAICLTRYETGTFVRILPCHHHYHQECIDQWICLTPNCPLCKRDILPWDGSSSA